MNYGPKEITSLPLIIPFHTISEPLIINMLKIQCLVEGQWCRYSGDGVLLSSFVAGRQVGHCSGCTIVWSFLIEPYYYIFSILFKYITFYILLPHKAYNYECILFVTSIASNFQLSIWVKMILQYCRARIIKIYLYTSMKHIKTNKQEHLLHSL